MRGQTVDPGPRWSRWARSTGVRGTLLLLAVAVAATSVILEPNARRNPAIAVLEVLVIVGFATAGFLVGLDPTQHANGRLLITSAVLQVFTHLHLIGHSPLPLLAWLSGPLSAMPAAVVLLRFPQRHADKIARRWIQFHLTWLVVSRLTFAVPAADRRLGWWPALPLSPSAASIASAVGNGVLSASTLFFGGLLVRRIVASKGATRHELVPVLTAAVSAVITVVLHLSSVATGRSGVSDLVLGIEQFALMSVPAAFLFSAIVMRMAHGAVSSLLLRVDVDTDRRGLQAALAETLSDPDLTLIFPDPAGSGWVNVDGKPDGLGDPTGRVDVPVPDVDGTPLAVLRVDATTLRHRAFLDATITAAALLLRNIYAVDELRNLPARIAEGSDRERSRIERDLHDGVQQRLIALGMSIDRVRHGDLDDATRQIASDAAAELQQTVRELRDLARGTYPAVLTDRGLLAAIESATDGTALDVVIDIPERRWPGRIEATAYFVTSEAVTNIVKHAGAAHARVQVLDDGAALTLTIADDGRGGAAPTDRSGLAGLTDRVHAVGGSLHIQSEEGHGTCLSARLPYA